MKKRTIILVMVCLLLTGCDAAFLADLIPAGTKEEAPVKEAAYIAPKTGEYDSADTAVIYSVAQEKQKITFLNIPTARRYTLEYDGTTVFTDKYGGGLSADQLKPGEVVDVTFLKNRKKCVGINISAQAWTYEGVNNYTLQENGGSISIGKENYKFTENMVILSEDGHIDIMDLNETDTLRIKGIDRTVYSIEVERGHGYLRLKNDEYFIGGWIEVGQSVIQKVTQDMLLAVPEGKYQVTVSNKGSGGTKDVTVVRNEEVELDVGDLKGEETRIGNVLFTLEPATADIYIDGDKEDSSASIALEYGIHQLIVKADGYDTITQYFKVGQDFANLDIKMEPSEEEESASEVSGNSADVSGNSTVVSGNDAGVSSNSSNTATAGDGSYQATIDAPKDAEVYLDGKYIGLAPVSFKKEAGTHVIILRKSGYRTRSYTIQIDSEPTNVNWSFADLVKSKTQDDDEN